MTADTETIRATLNREALREEWEALGMMSYHGTAWGYAADLSEDDIAKIRVLLNDAAAALGREEEREAEAAKMLQDAQEMIEEHTWGPSSVHRAASILTVVRRARAALADSVAGEEQGQTYGSDPGRASAASTSREGQVKR